MEFPIYGENVRPPVQTEDPPDPPDPSAFAGLPEETTRALNVLAGLVPAIAAGEELAKHLEAAGGRPIICPLVPPPLFRPVAAGLSIPYDPALRGPQPDPEGFCVVLTPTQDQFLAPTNERLRELANRVTQLKTDILHEEQRLASMKARERELSPILDTVKQHMVGMITGIVGAMGAPPGPGLSYTYKAPTHDPAKHPEYHGSYPCLVITPTQAR